MDAIHFPACSSGASAASQMFTLAEQQSTSTGKHHHWMSATSIDQTRATPTFLPYFRSPPQLYSLIGSCIPLWEGIHCPKSI